MNSQRCELATRSSEDSEAVPSMSGVSEVAACPQSPIADDPSALPSTHASPFSSQ